MKKRVLTEKEQQAVADVLNSLCFVKTLDELFAEMKKLSEQYGLCDDPFTHMYCTPKEYAKSSLEYDRQTMIQRYGHCDGLD